MIRNVYLFSYAIRREYIFKTFGYGVHNIGVQFVDLVEAPSYKYMEKDISHESVIINLYPGSCVQLMDLQEVPKVSHNKGTQKGIQKTNFVYIYLFYRLSQNN